MASKASGGSSCGLILLGNTGSGKSFLANVLLGRDAFKHEVSCDSVTHKTEFQEFTYNGQLSYAIFNIPGLIEADQSAVEQNKEEIYEAFRQRPNSFVAFVFSGGNGGRIKDEDLVAYRAINNVYDFKTGSFLIVVNDLPTDRPPTYEGEATVKLEKLLNMNNVTVCFLDRINKKVPRERDDLRIKLGSLVAKCTPKDKGDIELQVDQIKQLNEAARKQQEEFQNELRNLQGEIKKRQDEFNQSKKDFEKKLDGLRDELKKKDEAVERTQAQQRELESRVNALNIDMIKQKADHDLQLAQERDAASRQLLEQEHKTRMEELQREMIAAQEAIAIAEKKLDEGCVIL